MPPAITVEAIPDRTTVRLSDSLRVELRITGPAPLRLDPPQEWLAPESAGVWKIEPLGAPALADLPDGGQRWSQSFRLDPYTPGEAVPLAFAPVGVNGREVAWPEFRIAVTTTITNPKAEDARPVTGIETRPPVVRPQLSGEPWQYAVVALFLAITVYRLFHRRPKPKPEPTPGEWASKELAKLNVDDAGFADDLAGIVRGYLRRAFDVPADTRTTAELRAAHPEHEPLLELLDRCDRARYAGEKVNVDERDEMRRAVSNVV